MVTRRPGGGFGDGGACCCTRGSSSLPARASGSYPRARSDCSSTCAPQHPRLAMGRRVVTQHLRDGARECPSVLGRSLGPFTLGGLDVGLTERFEGLPGAPVTPVPV